MLDAGLDPDKLTQLAGQRLEPLSPFERTTLDKAYTFSIHHAIMAAL